MADGRSLIGSGEVDTRPASTRHASAPMDDDDERSPAVALDFGFHLNDHPATLRPEYADCPSAQLVEQTGASGVAAQSIGWRPDIQRRGNRNEIGTCNVWGLLLFIWSTRLCADASERCSRTCSSTANSRTRDVTTSAARGLHLERAKADSSNLIIICFF